MFWMGLVGTSVCSFCQSEDETILHLYSQCHFVIDLWMQLKVYFSRGLILPDITPQSAFLGFYDIDENKIIINQILLLFKMVIYKSREYRTCNLNKFINKVKQIKLIEDTISYKIPAKKEYNDKKWAIIDFVFE